MEVKVDPRRCTVDLSRFGEDNGSGFSSFSFTTRDRNGDIVSTNTVFGAKVMHQQDGVESEVIVKKVKDEGQYEVLFASLSDGLYLVVLGILSPNGTVIQDMVKGSPFTVRVGQEPEQVNRIAPEPSKCFVFGSGAKGTVLKRKTSFVLQACGPSGSKLKNGGDSFKVKVVPPAGGKLLSLSSSIQDQKDGTYTISFTPTAIGEHVVHLTLTGTEDVYVANSPFSIPTYDAMDQGEEVDPARVVIDLDHPVLLANDMFGFPIVAKNVNGQAMKVSVQFRARITGPEGLAVQNAIVECENGSFLLKVVPKQNGKHDFDIDVCANGSDQYAPVNGSPAILDLVLGFNEGKMNALKVQSKKRRDKVVDPSGSPSSHNKTPDAIPPRLALSRESGAINRTPPPQWIPPASGAKSPVKPPPKNPLTTTGRRSFSSPPPVSVSLLKSIGTTPAAPSSPSSTPSSPLFKSGVPPKNPSSPLSSLSASSPPAWLIKKPSPK